MIDVAKKPQTKAWAKAIPQGNADTSASSIKEFGPTPLPVVFGAVPRELRGSLYRNGPACLERGGQRVEHWFDGDGAILGVHFTDTGVTGLYRFVQTEGYQAEEKAKKLLYGGYGTIPKDLWNRFTKPAKNAANTSVIALPDKLLALWEGGQPHALDLKTLETFGLDNLGGLQTNLSYSAHPKRDPVTGDIYNIGVSFGKNGILHVYRSDRTGTIRQKAAIQLDGLPLIHDFVLAGQYLIFFVPPVRMNPLPVLTRMKSFSDALMWQPENGTQILILDRDTLEVLSRNEAEPWYQWHFANGYVDRNGAVMVDFIRYEDFQTNQYLKEVATGQTHTAAKGSLWQLRLDPHFSKVTQMQEVVNRPCEFPVVNPAQVGQDYESVYLSVHRQGVDIGQELFGAIAHFDYSTGKLTEADLGENCYPTEPLYVANPEQPGKGWILTVVFDSNRNSSEVWVFESDRLNDEPVCKLALPSVVPPGFHGTWKSA